MLRSCPEHCLQRAKASGGPSPLSHYTLTSQSPFLPSHGDKEKSSRSCSKWEQREHHGLPKDQSWESGHPARVLMQMITTGKSPWTAMSLHLSLSGVSQDSSKIHIQKLLHSLWEFPEVWQETNPWEQSWAQEIRLQGLRSEARKKKQNPQVHFLLGRYPMKVKNKTCFQTWGPGSQDAQWWVRK